jgi:PAS domain S-box-containing protein
MTITPVRGTDGEITNFIAINQDITARKEAELHRTRLSAILEASPDFVATADPDGKVLYLNSAARRLLELPEDVDASQVVIGDNHPPWAAELVLKTGIPSAIRDGVWSGETAFLTRSGREVPVIQVILAHKGADGSVEFLSTIARDIAERKRAEQEIRDLNATLEGRVAERTQQLEEASRAKSDFLANMSHELRTPLNSIIGFSEMLKDGLLGDLDKKQRVFVTDIFDAGTHLLSLINDILDLSKVEAGMLQLEPGAVDVPALLKASRMVVGNGRLRIASGSTPAWDRRSAPCMQTSVS